jgi:SAM-dependent methyltransferase
VTTLVPQSPGRTDTDVFDSYVRDYAQGRRIRILEAGCGRRWELSLEGVDFELVGVDLNAESLRLRMEKLGDLDTAIVGDLRTVELEPASFDVVFCSFLLEHIEGAEKVLDRMFAALKPGGLLLLRVPDRDGVYGWVARHTPHRMHIWYKRYVRKAKRAGTPGHGPFPVVYDKIISWRALQSYSAAHGYTILEAMSSNDHMDFFSERFRPLFERSLKTLAALSFGRLSADHANLSLVIRK